MLRPSRFPAMSKLVRVASLLLVSAAFMAGCTRKQLEEREEEKPQVRDRSADTSAVGVEASELAHALTRLDLNSAHEANSETRRHLDSLDTTDLFNAVEALFAKDLFVVTHNTHGFRKVMLLSNGGLPSFQLYLAEQAPQEYLALLKKLEGEIPAEALGHLIDSISVKAEGAVDYLNKLLDHPDHSVSVPAASKVLYGECYGEVGRRAVDTLVGSLDNDRPINVLWINEAEGGFWTISRYAGDALVNNLLYYDCLPPPPYLSLHLYAKGLISENLASFGRDTAAEKVRAMNLQALALELVDADEFYVLDEYDVSIGGDLNWSQEYRERVKLVDSLYAQWLARTND